MFTSNTYQIQFKFHHFLNEENRYCTSLHVTYDLKTIGTFITYKHPKDKLDKFVGKVQAFKKAMDYLKQTVEYDFDTDILWNEFHEAHKEKKI